MSRMHIAGETPVAAYRNEVRDCSLRTPVAGNGGIRLHWQPEELISATVLPKA